jgi:hypothetical protein
MTADFWDTFEKPAPDNKAHDDDAPNALNDTAGLCEFCGWVADDVLLGVCANCAPQE